MSLESDHLKCLAAALLSVNLYPVDRAAAVAARLDALGMLRPDACESQEILIEHLRNAGYDRGGYLPIVSYRLFALMDAVADGRLSDVPALVQAGDEASFREKLQAVHGFGPSTASVAWALLRAPRK